MDSANQKEQLMNELEHHLDPRQKLDANLKDQVERIGQGKKFQKKLEDVQSRRHFKEKYNLDYQVQQAVRRS